MEFESTNKDLKRYSSKFIRVGEQINVTAPNDLSTKHRSLAFKDGKWKD